MSLKELIKNDRPVPIVGTINAYTAKLAKAAGLPAIYLSGAGVANASLGVPDIGISTLDDVLVDAERIIKACDLPLLVDADTGFDDVAMTIRALESIGAAGCHIEDQVNKKRCGHLPGKTLVSVDEMLVRLDAALSTRKNSDFFIMARCDALENEGMEGVLARSQAYQQAGVDGIFVDAVTSIGEYKELTEQLNIPVMANMTEFGRTPLLTREDLAVANIAMMLFPLSAFRAMSQTAFDVYQTIAENGTQKTMLDKMQSREELYRLLAYKPTED
jgi:methylisocitrate lyase